MFLVSWACSIIALLLLWAVYPADFNFGQATAASYKFYEAQRVGNLPPSNSIPWRGPALLYERSPKFGFDDLTGGWLNGGAIGASPFYPALLVVTLILLQLCFLSFLPSVAELG